MTQLLNFTSVLTDSQANLAHNFCLRPGVFTTTKKEFVAYWKTRDMAVLAKNINESTAAISAVLGGLQSAAKDRGIVVSIVSKTGLL